MAPHERVGPAAAAFQYAPGCAAWGVGALIKDDIGDLGAKKLTLFGGPGLYLECVSWTGYMDCLGICGVCPLCVGVDWAGGAPCGPDNDAP